MNSEEYRKDLERKILIIIEEKLRKAEMDADRAKAIAQMMLEKLHPPLTLEQLYKIVPTLDDNFNELAIATLPLLKEHDEQLRTVVTQHAEKLIKSGKLDEAYQLLKNSE